MTMDYTRTFAVSALGMNIERARVDVAALNLANAHTVRDAGGVAYQPLRVVADARVIARQLAGDDDARSFAALVEQGARFSDGVPNTGIAGVRIMPAAVEPRRVYEPDHPLADEKGFMTYAGVDPATEMVTLLSATQAYKANVEAMNTTRALALKALEIGGRA
jgi:flagellar basal-body rod protein FlgC